MLELYKKATKLGFFPSNLSIGWKEDPYLWMCELQKWLREQYKLQIAIEPVWGDDNRLTIVYNWLLYHTKEEEDAGMEEIQTPFCDTYEQALKAALLETTSLIK